jgi:hypothetical protein
MRTPHGVLELANEQDQDSGSTAAMLGTVEHYLHILVKFPDQALKSLVKLAALDPKIQYVVGCAVCVCVCMCMCVCVCV